MSYNEPDDFLEPECFSYCEVPENQCCFLTLGILCKEGTRWKRPIKDNLTTQNNLKSDNSENNTDAITGE